MRKGVNKHLCICINVVSTRCVHVYVGGKHFRPKIDVLLTITHLYVVQVASEQLVHY